MKKAMSVFFVFVMLFGSFAGALKVSAAASTEVNTEANIEASEENSFVYVIENDYAIITDYTYTEFTGDVVIPSTLGGYPVREIGKEAFRGSLCKSITIPVTVTEIHPEAFAYDMPNLEAYYGASSVYNTKEGILYKHIYGYNMLFAYPKNAPEKTHKINGGLVYGVSAFAFCEANNLEEFAITGIQYTAVDNYAFYGAKNLKKITVENCLAIGEKAFANCENLADIDIDFGKGAFGLGSDAFENTAFTNDLSNYDTDGVLYYDSYLITSLPEYDREYYEIKDGTTVIAGGAFDWDKLEEVSIPGSLVDVTYNPFYRCDNLKTFDVNNLSVLTVDAYGVLWQGSTLVSYPNGRYRTCYVIDRGTEVSCYAFYNSPVQNFYILEDIILNNYALGSDNVTDIHYQGEKGNWLADSHLDPGYGDLPNAAHSANVRFNSYSAETHTILTKTDAKATCSCGYETEFEKENGEYSENGFTYRIVDGKAEIVSCPSFVTGELVIPEIIGGFVVASIANNAFDTVKCTGVFIPSAVEKIDKSSGLAEISTLKGITVAAGNMYFMSENGVLYNKDKTILLVYPDAKTAGDFTVPESVETIVANAVRSNRNLTSVTINGNLKTIETNAFASCTSLETLNIKSGVDYIGDYAFRYCYRLHSVSLTESIGYIGKDVFQFSSFVDNDANYTTGNVIVRDGCLVASKEIGGNGFMVPEGTTVIAEGVFKWENIESVHIPASVVTVGDAAFKDCPAIKEFYVDSGSKYLSTDEYGALYNKDKTKLIAYPAGNRQACFFVPDGVTEIAPYALDFDDMLSNKYVPLSVKKIGKNGLGINPDMIINYQGHLTDFVQIDFAGDTEYKKFLINTVEKKYSAVSAGTHYNSELAVTDPTCSEKGSETITCECGYQHINEIPRNGHKATGNMIVIQPATCTTREILGRYCSVCGELAETIYNSSLGHKYVKTEQEASCEQAGGTFYECARCGDSYSENYVEPHGHTVTNGSIKIKATCTENGGWYPRCDTCHQAVGEPLEIYEATGHTEGEWTVETEATCEDDGLETLPCSVCGETLDSRVIEKSHDYKETVINKTCTFEKLRYRCTGCGDEYYREVYYDKEHGSLEEVIEEPGCFAPGKKYNRCTACGVTVGEVEVIPSTGHNHEVIETKEATCTQAGYEKIQCTKCGNTKTTHYPKTAHKLGKWKYEGGNAFSGICLSCNTSFESVNVYLTLDKTSIITFSGMNEKLTPTVTGIQLDNVSYTTSDRNVVMVAVDGTVIARAPGKATITAKISGTEISATCTVTVLSKAYLVNWMVDDEVYVVSSVKEGESITPPAPPEKEGYEFVGWSPEIPDAMPSEGLAFTAVFNKISKSDEFDVSATYSPEAFDEPVSLDVNEIKADREPGGVYMVEGAYYEQVGLYNIKALNEKSDVVQPNDGYKVTIKIALPEAYKSKKDFVIYHRFVGGGREQLSTAAGTVRVEDGYLVFEVESFSEFEIFVPSPSIKIVSAPAKVKYYYGEELDLSGIRVTYTDANGNVKTVSNTSFLTVSGFDSSKTGKQTVTVNYDKYSDTFEVEVRFSFLQWILRILFFGFIKF